MLNIPKMSNLLLVGAAANGVPQIRSLRPPHAAATEAAAAVAAGARTSAGDHVTWLW